MNNKPTKNTATVRIKTDLEKPMDIDLIAEHIKSISDNFDKAMKSGLTKRAISVLLHDAIPYTHGIGIKQIETILDYAPLLKKFLTK